MLAGRESPFTQRQNKVVISKSDQVTLIFVHNEIASDYFYRYIDKYACANTHIDIFSTQDEYTDSLTKEMETYSSS